jgi:molybdopterin converting factor small subunit
LRPHTGGAERLEVTASTVDEALAEVAARFPEAGARIRQAMARRYVVVSVGGRDIRDLAEGETRLAAGDEVHLLWAVAGG